MHIIKTLKEWHNFNPSGGLGIDKLTERVSSSRLAPFGMPLSYREREAGFLLDKTFHRGDTLMETLK